MGIGTANINGVLVPSVPSTAITGQSWVAFENVGQQQYPLSAQNVQPSSLSNSGGGVNPGGMTPKQSSNFAQALSSPLSLTHGVVLPTLLMFIVGIVILDLVFFRKGKSKNDI